MRRWPPRCGGSKLKGRLPSSRAPAIGAGQSWNTHRSVIPALGATAPGLTLGAAPSKSTRERPCASFPVTTRRMGRSFSVMWFYSIQLQVRLLHDRCVSVVLSPEELGVLLGRVARRLLAQGEEAFPDF